LGSNEKGDNDDSNPPHWSKVFKSTFFIIFHTDVRMAELV
jgi:hypothetical protein